MRITIINSPHLGQPCLSPRLALDTVSESIQMRTRDHTACSVSILIIMEGYHVVVDRDEQIPCRGQGRTDTMSWTGTNRHHSKEKVQYFIDLKSSYHNVIGWGPRHDHIVMV
jgi:hypothetical protein